jgi:alpha-glucoside transport system substrate-binding protein
MKRLILVVVLLTLTALMVACGGGAAVEEPAQEAAPTEAVVAETAPTEEAAPEVVPTEEPAMDEDMAEGSYLERAEAGEFTGKTVSLLGVMVDEEAQKMNLALAPFEEATGIDVVYEGSKEFETQINVAVDAGAPPDVANISQPAMVERFAAVGALTDISSFLPREKLQETYIDSWLDMATMPGADGEDIMAGVWQRASAKSMVFYPKA